MPNALGRRDLVEVDALHQPPAIEGREREPHSVSAQLGDQVIQLSDAGPPGDVGGNRGVRSAAQDVVDECGEVAAGAGFDEQPDIVGVHVLDGLADSTRTYPVLVGQVALFEIDRIAPVLVAEYSGACGSRAIMSRRKPFSSWAYSSNAGV
jgi:hypothetical protein